MKMFGIARPLFFCLLFITLQSLMSEMIRTMFDEHIQRNTPSKTKAQHSIVLKFTSTQYKKKFYSLCIC